MKRVCTIIGALYIMFMVLGYFNLLDFHVCIMPPGKCTKQIVVNGDGL